MEKKIDKMADSIVQKKAGSMSRIVKDMLITLAKERKKFLDWLCSSDVNPKHSKVLEATENTGKWIFSNQAYEKWLSSTGSVLWIRGKGTTFTHLH